MSNLADQIIVLLCHERSGSTYLTDCLARAGGIIPAGDLWNHAAQGEANPLGFHRFRADWLRARGTPASPLDDTLFPLLDDFFTAIAAAHPGRRVLVDIKYAHLHAVSGFWFSASHGSLFFAYLRARRIPLLHLYRRDVFAAVASLHLALQRGVWNARATAPQGAPKITLEAGLLGVQLAGLAAEVMAHRLFCTRLGGLNLGHEDLVKGTAFAGIKGHLGIQWSRPPGSDIVKISPEPEEFVANFAELKDVTAAYRDIDTAPPVQR